MGYYTVFTPREELNQDHIKFLEELSDYSDEVILGECEAKWYDFEEHLKKLSSKFKDKKFIYECQGEEPENLYRVGALNGKTVTVEAVITWPEIDFKG